MNKIEHLRFLFSFFPFHCPFGALTMATAIRHLRPVAVFETRQLAAARSIRISQTLRCAATTRTARAWRPGCVRFATTYTHKSPDPPAIDRSKSKLYRDADEAVADIKSGSVILSSGFGLCGVAGETFPLSLLEGANPLAVRFSGRLMRHRNHHHGAAQARAREPAFSDVRVE